MIPPLWPPPDPFTLDQPAKFEYLTEFKGEDESGLEEQLRRINGVCSFTIKTAKAQTTMRDLDTAKTITVKHLVYRAMDRTTGLQFDLKAEQNTWHVQRIAWKDYNKPKGYYSAKAAMKRFKKELLDGLGKDFVGFVDVPKFDERHGVFDVCAWPSGF